MRIELIGLQELDRVVIVRNDLRYRDPSFRMMISRRYGWAVLQMKLTSSSPESANYCCPAAPRRELGIVSFVISARGFRGLRKGPDPSSSNIRLVLVDRGHIDALEKKQVFEILNSTDAENRKHTQSVWS